MMYFPGIEPSEILLPKAGTDLQKWAVIACDQYTSQPEYWERVRAFVGEAPSTLKLMQPEAFLKEGDHTAEINATMDSYLEQGILVEPQKKGFVLVERTTKSGKRIGLVAALDLEQYDFKTETLLTRATEDTVADRLPPRVRIREQALLELPHVMVLLDDPKMSVIEALYLNVRRNLPAYDFDLMENGGHLRGWRVDGEKELEQLSEALAKLEESADGFLYAVGDGNHSLATAKICWENRKAAHPEVIGTQDPARYALIELVNLHSEAILFEPIHRVLFDCDAEKLQASFNLYLAENHMRAVKGTQIRFLQNGEEIGIDIQDNHGLLPVAVLQTFLDRYLKDNPKTTIDYIHGESAVRNLCGKAETVGILLEGIAKDSFFDGIRAGGHLPRKTFSMGEADEKRFYMECRKIK